MPQSFRCRLHNAECSKAALRSGSGQSALAVCLVFVWVLTTPLQSMAQDVPMHDQQLEVRGLVISRMRTTLSAEVDARVESIQVDMGDHFKKGQLLVLLSQETYRAHQDRARSELKSAQLNLQANEKMQALHSISELDVALSRVEVEQKESVLRLQSYALQRCRIEAPFSGRVVQRLVKPHQFVTTGTPLIEIVDDTALQVQAFLPSWVGVQIRNGQPFVLKVDETGRAYQGTIQAIGAVVDENSQMIEVRGNIAEALPDLLAGMSGLLRFDIPAKRAQTATQ